MRLFDILNAAVQNFPSAIAEKSTEKCQDHLSGGKIAVGEWCPEIVGGNAFNLESEK